MRVQAMKTGRRCWATGVVAAMLVAVAPVSAATLRLQAKAVVEDGAVRVGDVATITGMRDGESVAEVVVLEALPKDGARVKAEQVLFAIAAAKGMKATTDLQIAGSADCLVVRKGEESKFTALAVPGTPAALKKAWDEQSDGERGVGGARRLRPRRQRPRAQRPGRSRWAS